MPSLQIGDTTVMASDGIAPARRASRASRCRSTPRTKPRPKRLFDALSDGGQVQMPLGKTFFASSFGMVADKFGVSWMVIAAGDVARACRASRSPPIWNAT